MTIGEPSKRERIDAIADRIALSWVMMVYARWADDATAAAALDRCYHRLHFGHWPRYVGDGDYCQRCGLFLTSVPHTQRPEVMMDTIESKPLRHTTIIGRERALIDGLSNALQRMIGGPPPSKETLAEVRRHESMRPVETFLGNAFEVRLVGPDGEVTGHIVRVTIELARFEAAHHD